MPETKEAQNIPNLTLILGGARSGKSALAERLCKSAGARPVYVATAEAGDGEMAARIAAHRRDRGPGWRTIEAPLDLPGALAEAGPAPPVLIDCLTLWLTNRFFAAEAAGEAPEAAMPDWVAALGAAVAARQGPVVCVSNEIGLGLVPETALGRRFRDLQGRLNQAVAARAAQVVFVAAGLPLVLKGGPL